MDWIRTNSKRDYTDRNDTIAYSASLANYAYGLSVLGRFDKAKEQANEALAVDAQNRFALKQKLVAEGSLINQQGLASFSNNKIEEAIQFFEEALTYMNAANDSKRQATYLCNHGYGLIKLGRFDEALLKLKQALDRDPDSTFAKDWMRLAEEGIRHKQTLELNDQGNRFLKQNEYEKALESYEGAFNMSLPDDFKNRATFLTNQALVLINLKRFSDAIDKCNKALQINPKSKIAKKQIELASRSYNQTLFG